MEYASQRGGLSGERLNSRREDLPCFQFTRGRFRNCKNFARGASWPKRATVRPKLPRQSGRQFPNLGPIKNRPEMHIRGKAELTRRCCAATVEAGAWRCHHCGEAHPTSELRAVVFEGGLFLSARDARAYAMCSRKIFCSFPNHLRNGLIRA